MDYNTLRYERKGRVGILTLNRPEKLNALSLELVREMNDFLSHLAEEDDTHVVIVRGEGRAFCAGADLSDPEAERDKMAPPVPEHYERQIGYSNIIIRMRQVPQPLIAAVRGPAVGGGWSITMACDVRIAGESARFDAAFVRIGLSGGDMGSSYFLPRLVGFSHAAELLYTGRFIDAATAYRIGLVSRVVPDDQVDEAAMELAEEMLSCSPFGLRMTKEVLNQNIDAPSLAAAIRLEDRTQVLCSRAEDFQEGRLAFLEKRAPVYRNR